MSYITEPGTYIAFVEESRAGYLHQDDKGRVVLRIPVQTGDGKRITWSAYLSTEGGKTRAAKAMIEALKAPANWATLLMQNADIISGKKVAVVCDYDKDGNGEVKVGKNGKPFISAKWLNDPDRQGSGGDSFEGKPVDLKNFESLAREMKSVSQNFLAEQTGKEDRSEPKPHRPVAEKTFHEDLESDDIPF
jgi:hypothetical protein